MEKNNKALKFGKGNKNNRTIKWLTQHDHHTHGKYIGNINTLIYHYPGCFETIKMKKEHKINTNNTMGLYRACKKCKPYLKGFQETFEETNMAELKNEAL